VSDLSGHGSEKNRDIEVLRAIAISYVIATHWVPHFLGRFGSLGPWFTQHTALASGVDLFFCISGYVIARSILATATAGASIRSFAAPFWIRRIFRLWPSAWLWAVIPLLLSVAWNRSGGFGGTSPAALDAAMAALNIENFHYYGCLRTQTCGPLGVYWSLSLEEQFYWIFPVLVLLLRRRALIALLTVLAAVQIALPRPNSFSTVDPSLLWLVRTDAICLGILLALFERSGGAAALPPLLRTRLRAGLLSFMFLVVLAVAAAPVLRLAHATGILALASAALVWMARFDRGLIIPRTRFDPVLLWVGSRSYSLYLIHATAGRAASEFRDRLVAIAPHTGQWLGVLTGVVLTIGLTVGLAELNFRCLETPLRAAGRRLSRRLTRDPREPTSTAPAGGAVQARGLAVTKG
jgi:peptidoglycan/LPS O-acetylase OafA/YrhL